MVKRLLREYGYPPDMQALAIELVLEQAKVLASIREHHKKDDPITIAVWQRFSQTIF